MQDADPVALAESVDAIHVISKDDDVREHAVIIVASLLTGAESPLHAARAAVRIAQRAIALSRSLDDWDSEGDMTETVETAWNDAESRGTITRYAPDPATRYAYTCADLVDMAVSVAGKPLGDLVSVARLHASTCATCDESKAQRVTLAGVAAHTYGLTSADSAFHSLRRAAISAVKSAPTMSDTLSALGDPAPMSPANVPHSRVSLGDCKPVSTRNYLSPVRTVIVNGTPRAMTQEETALAYGITPAREVGPVCRTRCEHDSCATIRRANVGRAVPNHSRYAGEGYDVPTAPNTRDLRANGTMPTFKPVVSPRKRAGAGSTGPTVRAF